MSRDSPSDRDRKGSTRCCQPTSGRCRCCSSMAASLRRASRDPRCEWAGCALRDSAATGWTAAPPTTRRTWLGRAASRRGACRRGNRCRRMRVAGEAHPPSPPSSPTVHNRRIRVGARRGKRAATRGEHDAFAIGRPAAHEVATRMPREPLRLAACRGHDVDIRVAGDRRRERDLRAIGREIRIRFLTRSAREPSSTATRASHDPEVAAVLEGDVVVAHGGAAQEARALCGEWIGSPSREAAKQSASV